MKKMFRIISFTLVFLLSFVSVVGCSCSSIAKVAYSFELINQDTEDMSKKLAVVVKTVRKYREPANTPCYEKKGDTYELIPNPEGITKCYDKDGNEFERATYDKIEKKELNIDGVILQNNVDASKNILNFDSDRYEVPKNEKQSIIFEANIENRDSSKSVKIESLNFETIIGNQIKVDAISKVKIELPQAVEGYYILSPNQKITIKIEVKGLKAKDLRKGIKFLTLELPLKTSFI